MSENEVKLPQHFSQAFNIPATESELDFFDVNLEYDSKLFIDPFLIKKSSVEEERALFVRFGDFFRYAYDKALELNTNTGAYEELKLLLSFREPKEIGLGYTEASHEGAGPGASFAAILLQFFIHNTAKRLIKDVELYPDEEFNPITLEIFTEGLGPDGLSDITANLLMDYLIKYTQVQCEKYGIPTKQLPLNEDGFDFAEKEWRGGGYYQLPENPLWQGQAVVLVPKRFLRATESNNDRIESKVKGILEQDPELKRRFSMFLSKSVDEISMDDIRSLFLQEESIFKKYLEVLSTKRADPYDFETDILQILAIKTYSTFFADKPAEEKIQGCDDLLTRTEELIDIFNTHISVADGWKEMWTFKGSDVDQPQREAVMGRVFRGMGFAYFHRTPEVTFVPEAGTGNGPVDFLIAIGNCRIAIELKRLMNASMKGEPPLASYLHGIERQLPNYALLSKATHAIYITGQHYTSTNRPKASHDKRVEEIRELVPIVEKKMKTDIQGFVSLKYFNIRMSPHSSASSI